MFNSSLRMTLNTFTTLSTGEREREYIQEPFLYCAYVIGLDLEKTGNKSLKIITHGSLDRKIWIQWRKETLTLIQ